MTNGFAHHMHTDKPEIICPLNFLEVSVCVQGVGGGGAGDKNPDPSSKMNLYFRSLEGQSPPSFPPPHQSYFLIFEQIWYAYIFLLQVI